MNQILFFLVLVSTTIALVRARTLHTTTNHSISSQSLDANNINVVGSFEATLTERSFEGEIGNLECDNGQYERHSTQIVALPALWFDSNKCNSYVTIQGNYRSTNAVLVDRCDKCDGDVQASPDVWKALGVQGDGRWGGMPVTWTYLYA